MVDSWRARCALWQLTSSEQFIKELAIELAPTIERTRNLWIHFSRFSGQFCRAA